MRPRPALTVCLIAALALTTGCSRSTEPRAKRPNIILIITDDQGYGDIGALGNRMIRTPNLDRLHAESVRFTDFHVDPTCAPTRAALMTGRYSSRTGVWHTIMGRSILDREEVTLADSLRAAGYRTGFFGKWHLGDAYSYRPQDRGFEKTVMHGGGGVQQTPDYWGNDYFDDTYWNDGHPTKYEGYCTDVWFREALRFIDTGDDRPFFAYISTNAPHSPYFVDPKYARPYLDQGIPQPMANFYGMIENIDENIGVLRAHLAEKGLDRDTMLVFLTDNGTAAGFLQDSRGFARSQPGWGGFNAGMRGVKGSEYEGGHRVPFWIHWPGGSLGAPRDVPALAAHIDVLPTLLDLVQAPPPDADLDGRSLKPLLGGGDWPERTLLVHSQRVDIPEKWRKSAVMTAKWRLINGAELYDLEADPGQTRDVAAGNPEVVTRLRGEYESWWTHIAERFDDHVYLLIGGEENPTRITAHDWRAPDSDIPWNQPAIEKAPLVNGVWMVEVASAGAYEFTLHQRDAPADFPIDAVEARIRIGDREARAAVPPGATAVTLKLDLPAGQTRLQTWFKTRAGRERGAFFVYARRL